MSTNAVFEEDESGVVGRGPHEILSSTYEQGVHSRVTPGLDLDAEDPALRERNQLHLKRFALNVPSVFYSLISSSYFFPKGFSFCDRCAGHVIYPCSKVPTDLHREIEYATFLGIQVIQMDLHRKHNNLAATLQNCLQQLEPSHNVPVVWMIVPLVGASGSSKWITGPLSLHILSGVVMFLHREIRV